MAASRSQMCGAAGALFLATTSGSSRGFSARSSGSETDPCRPLLPRDCFRFKAKMWARWMVYILLGGTASSLKCLNGHTCEGVSTCCKLPEGDEYACCNQPQLMRASQGTLYAESSNKIPGVVCPDGTTCPEEYSCVHTEGSSFACCPWKEATSCADKRHCCPSGSYCSADGQLCLQNEVLTSTKFGAVQCPDGESECPNETTCCLMADGSWGCCPMPEASCCADRIHCCPHGTQCDLAHEKCLEASGEQPLQKKFPARKRAPVASVPQRNICPDNQSSCPETATCCQLPSGHYGCCPLPNAVCCRDHLHCCSQGTKCDLAHSKCITTQRQLLPIAHLPVDVQTTHEVRCDAEHSCPDGNTCCKQASGTWGCCPLPQAVCCTDGRHCCPEGYTCKSSLGICLKTGHSLPWARKLPAGGPQSRGIRCNDTASCKEGQTCCRSVSGDWSCCQLPKAVCCEDHLHCCPSGYTCNVEAQSCEKQPRPKSLDVGALLAAWFAAASSQDSPCGDQHYCRGEQTCCKAHSGGWACCPYSKGTCCLDRRHCCPPGFYCSRSGFECFRRQPLRWDISIFSPHSAPASPLV